MKLHPHLSNQGLTGTPIARRKPMRAGKRGLLAACAAIGVGMVAWAAPSEPQAQDAQQPELRPRRGEDGPDGLRRPPRPGRADRPSQAGERPQGPQRYSLEQALSERAQLHTIAFSGLAFLSGDFAADTFLPPGKVSDYFGFQYLRDIDAAQAGHSTSFLTRIAHNMLGVLTPEQRAMLMELARVQQADIRNFAEMRLPLMKAFRRQLEASAPASNVKLNREAVMRHSAELYALDGRIAWERARVMAQVARSLSPEQKAAIAQWKFGDSRTWPDASAPPERRQLNHAEDVALMTYASEMYAWLAGSLDADVYFCPERHGMYFGGFGLKTAPAMGKKDYAISTALTGDSGAAFLSLLTPTQREHITQLPAQQRAALSEIVTLRRQIAAALRKFLDDRSPNADAVVAWSRRYGELDGQLSYELASAFTAVGQSLSAEQRTAIQALRASGPQAPKGPFLYSQAMDARTLARIGNADALFSPAPKAQPPKP